MDDPTSRLKTQMLTNLQRLSGRIENLEAQLQRQRQNLESAIDELRILPISEMPHAGETAVTPRPYVDRRSLPNPEKNLKISAIRSLEWSKMYGRNAKEARTRAIAVIEKSARTLGFKHIPVGVVAYLDAMADNYDHLKAKGQRGTKGAPAS